MIVCGHTRKHGNCFQSFHLTGCCAARLEGGREAKIRVLQNCKTNFILCFIIMFFNFYFIDKRRDTSTNTSQIRDGSKFMGYPGMDHRQGGEDFFFEKNQGGRDSFLKTIRGRRLFFQNSKKIHDLIFQKAIFINQEVIYAGSSDSGVFIGV